nr:large subunit ribosomal protein L3 [uncultured archaeon]
MAAPKSPRKGSLQYWKIFSVRFYKNGKVVKEVLNENLDKELKRIIKIPKQSKKIEEFSGDYDDARILCYSVVKKTGIKKTPDLSEIAIGGNLDNKINFIKANLGKEISVSDIFEKGKLVDFRGLTKGKGLQGPVKRFGITLKSHKSEKGSVQGPAKRQLLITKALRETKKTKKKNFELLELR